MISIHRMVWILWICLIVVTTVTRLLITRFHINLYDDDKSINGIVSRVKLFNLSLSQNKWRTFEPIPETSFWVYNYTGSAVCGRDKNNNPAIFIAACTDKKSSAALDCHIVYDGESKFETVPATMDIGIYYTSRCLASYIWCPIQSQMRPIYVELQAKHAVKGGKKRIYVDSKIPCEKQNQIAPRKLNKPKIGLCMEYNYNITSARSLAEYVELHRLLGVEKAMLHGFDYVSKEVLQLIKYYHMIGFLEFLPWRTTGFNLFPRFFKADCLVRFRGQVDYMLFDDVDEFIIPSSEKLPETLPSLIKHLKKYKHREDGEICSFTFQWTSFCIDEFVHHRNKQSTITGEFQTRYNPTYTIKSIMNVNLTYFISDHKAAKCRSGYNIHIGPGTAKVHHYRAYPGKTPAYVKGTCETVDNATQRYQARLLDRVNFVIAESQDPSYN